VDIYTLSGIINKVYTAIKMSSVSSIVKLKYHKVGDKISQIPLFPFI